MSKGSPIVSVRVNPLLLASIDNVVARINKRRREEPLTRSTFILNCVLDKFDHLERSLKSKRPKQATPGGKIIDPEHAALNEVFQTNDAL